MRGHRYVLALGSYMHAPEHSSFVSDGVQVRSGQFVRLDPPDTGK